MKPQEREKPGLSEWQRWLAWAITDPRGVTSALAGPSPAEPLPRLLEKIAKAPPLSPDARLGIYAEAYFSRLRDALAGDFETLRLVLGDDFDRLIARYLAAHPSRARGIGEVGEFLPAFIATWEEGAAKAYLSDLARLEWALIEAFFADDVLPLDPVALAAVPEEAWLGARFRIDPSARILDCEWPVDELWQARGGDLRGILTRFRSSPVSLLVHRPRHETHVTRLTEGQKVLLEALLRGATLNDALERVKNGGEMALQQWFTDWVSSGVIRKIEF